MNAPTFEGLPLIPTRSAMNEMCGLGVDMWMLLEVLESGYDCSRSPRKPGTLERCIDRGRRTTKAVVAKAYNHTLETEAWIITHVGTFTKRR